MPPQARGYPIMAMAKYAKLDITLKGDVDLDALKAEGKLAFGQVRTLLTTSENSSLCCYLYPSTVDPARVVLRSSLACALARRVLRSRALVCSNVPPTGFPAREALYVVV